MDQQGLPVRLQTLCRSDGLCPEPLRQTTVTWSDVTSRSPSPPVQITAARRIYLFNWVVCFGAVPVQEVDLFQKI